MKDKEKSRNRKPRKKQKLLEEMSLMDDEFMTLIFNENYEATELVLNVILGRKDLKVKTVEVQKTENSPLIGGKSQRLDVYAVDTDGKTHNIEVQQDDRGADIHRARYYSAVIDSRLLRSGQEYEELNDSYVIFITKNDVMGLGWPIYLIERTLIGDGRNAEDGSHILYVNGAYKNDGSEIGHLISDFKATKYEEIYFPALRKTVQYYKENKEGKRKMSKIFEKYAAEYAAEVAAEAAAKAAAEARLNIFSENVRNLMCNMNLNVVQAMEALNIPEADRETVLKLL